jgi:AraC-like DNA-binding protein
VYFNLYNLLIFFGVGQGLILGLIILFLKKEGDQTAIFLATLIISFALTTGKHLVVDLQQQNFWLSPIVLPISFFLIMGPLLYFYIKSTVLPQFRMTFRDWRHFLPAFILLLFQLGLFLSTTVFSDTTPSSITFPLQLIEQIGGLVSFFVYGFLGLQLVKEYQRWIAQEYSNHEYITLAWLRTLLIALLIGWILLVGFTFFDVFFHQFHLPPSAYYPLLLYVSVLIYWMGFKQLMRAKLPGPSPAVRTHEEDITTVPQKNLEDLRDEVARVEAFVTHQKPYLDPELKLDKLAALLNLHPKTLSHLLNKGLHASFYDYTNRHRVEEVKQKLTDPKYDNYTLLGIALESGFNSKSTFNHIFKKLTHQTPLEYKRNITENNI